MAPHSKALRAPSGIFMRQRMRPGACGILPNTALQQGHPATEGQGIGNTGIKPGLSLISGYSRGQLGEARGEIISRT